MTLKIRLKRTIDLVRIPAGEFIMGSRPGQGEPDEFPQHSVCLDEYLIGRYLVTAEEWAGFLNSIEAWEDYFEPTKETTVTRIHNKFYPRRGCATHPANGVTWHGATAFCQWLSQQTSRPFRLPTEAEWEKAARGGQAEQRFPWGNDSPEGLAQHQQVWASPRLTLSPVGSYPPNPYGLYDLSGNVWEWCSDWYDRNYYHDSPRLNPQGPGSGHLKVLRGGSWGALDIQIRCGIRVGENPYVSESRVGFRLARPS